MNTNSPIITILLTSTVIASFLTSIANIVIAKLNNNRLKSIEKKKRKNEIITYRYTHLYDVLLKWKEYDSHFETKNRTPLQIAKQRGLNSFYDSYRRFQIISPLLDEGYKKGIEELYQSGMQFQKKLFAIEFELDKKTNDDLKKEHDILLDEFIDLSLQYTSEIEKVVQLQLEKLLKEHGM